MFVISPFLQSLRTSSDCNDFSNMMKSGLAIMSANSIRTLGCISLGPTDLHMFTFFKWSQTWSSTIGGTSFPQSLPQGLQTWEMWEVRLTVKTEAKKGNLSTSAFSMSVITSSPVVFIGVGSLIFLFRGGVGRFFMPLCSLLFLPRQLWFWG